MQLKYFLFICFLLFYFTFFLIVECDPWRELLEKEGLQISFIFYKEANGINNCGVVLYLINANDYDIEYEFTLIFRAGNDDKIQRVTGQMCAGEKRTGSNFGLFWIPFENKRAITELGITKCRVKRLIGSFK